MCGMAEQFAATMSPPVSVWCVGVVCVGVGVVCVGVGVYVGVDVYVGVGVGVGVGVYVGVGAWVWCVCSGCIPVTASRSGWYSSAHTLLVTVD